MTTARRIQLGLVALGLGGLAVALWDVSMGGFYFNVLGIRVSSWEAYKPFRIGMLAMIGALWLNDRAAAPDLTSWRASLLTIGRSRGRPELESGACSRRQVRS